MDELNRMRRRDSIFERLIAFALKKNEKLLPIIGQGICFWDSLAEEWQAQTGYRVGMTGREIFAGVISILRQCTNSVFMQHCKRLADHFEAYPSDYSAMDILVMHAATGFF
jgi:hypothetical protein